ncbi:MAG: acetolactate synthase large subunit [Desulfobacteraceae bacterium]|nr:acetolactate synthase large subunit [Desulfobacteraceae bacterium]
MNGADCLMRALADAGVTLCFTNPGTTEIHLVAALEQERRIRTVLGLFEGVCSGAADGFARMTGRPAVNLLHLGPGLANAMANLHNARRARSPVVNLVGDHPVIHRRNDPPLASDIATMAAPVSGWVRESADALALPEDGVAAVRAALGLPGQVATLVIPADCAWGTSQHLQSGIPQPEASPLSESAIAKAVGMLRSGAPTALVLGGKTLLEPGLRAAARIAQRSGAAVLSQTFDARFARGAGLPLVQRLPYFPERARKRLAACSQFILVGTHTPISFFAYPNGELDLLPKGSRVEILADEKQDAARALETLAEALGAGQDMTPPPMLKRPERPTGALTAESAGAAIGALLPEGAVVSDESGTSGEFAYRHTVGAPPHDWLCLTGGSIGQGVPVGTGAALACPQRPVICLQGDGGAMYTLQALWTQAREALNVTTVIFSNRKYQILQVELQRLGFTTPSAALLSTMELSRPDLDWVKLAQGMGVPAARADSAEVFTSELERALAEPGPHLIEALL